MIHLQTELSWEQPEHGARGGHGNVSPWKFAENFGNILDFLQTLEWDF